MAEDLNKSIDENTLKYKNSSNVIEAIENVEDKTSNDLETTNEDYTNNDNLSKTETYSIALKYTPKEALSVLTPVTICMFLNVLVSLLTKIAFNLNNEREDFLNIDGSKKKFGAEKKDEINGTTIYMMCLFFLIWLIVSTSLILCIVKLNLLKLLSAILVTIVSILFLFVNTLFWLTISAAFNCTLDLITCSFLIVNNAVLAVFTIMWKGPKKLTQAYHIYLSVLIAWYLDTLTPLWMGWLMLTALSVWDAIAVIPKYGPLNTIIRILEKRGKKLPTALVYSTYFEWRSLVNLSQNRNLRRKDSKSLNKNPIYLKASSLNLDRVSLVDEIEISYENSGKKLRPGFNENNNNLNPIEELDIKQSQSAKPTKSNQTIITEDQDEGKPKLGLGDFVFYSLLIGKSASQFNLTTIVACFLAIIVGLSATIVLVAILQRPLPALPIPVLFAVFIFFTSEYAVVPFINVLNINQKFI